MLNDLRDTFGFRIPEIFGRGFCPEYQRVYDAFITKPPNSVAKDHNIMVEGTVNDGDWQTKDIFYITAAQTAADSLINWINPGTHDLTVVNLVAGQFTAYRGWTGNGVNGYLDTNYNPNTDGINYALDDGSFGCYLRLNVQEDGCVFGCEDLADNGIYLYPRHSGLADKLLSKLNDDTFTQVANIDSRGMFIVSRDVNVHKDIYINKIKTEQVEPSILIPDFELSLLAENDTGSFISFSTNQIAEAHAGGAMTQTNVNNFTDRIETFMDSIGAAI